MSNCKTCPDSNKDSSMAKPVHDANLPTKKPLALSDASNRGACSAGSSNTSSSSGGKSGTSSDSSKNSAAGKCDSAAAEAVPPAAASGGSIAKLQPPALTLSAGLSRFELQMLLTHNAYREHHSTPPLAPCPILAKRAQCWAETLASRNCMFHERQDFDGENLAMMYGAPGAKRPGNVYVNLWYYEGLYYRFPGTQGPQNGNGKNQVTGHFTQLVWKNSRQVGFGLAVSRTGRVYVVARYRPRGNWIGWFNANVLPPKDGKLRSRFCP